MSRFPFYPPDRAAFFETYAAEFHYEQAEPTPWMPLRRPLRFCKLALATFSGMRSPAQAPSAPKPRTIPVSELRRGAAFDSPDFPPSEAERDANVLVPIDALLELAERRMFAELFPSILSFPCGVPDAGRARDESASSAEFLRREGVDALLLLTAGYRSNETACLFSREVEKSGVSTLCLVTIREVAEQIRVPRALYLPFPFGMLFGRRFNHSLQLSIATDLLDALATLDRPGRIVDLPYRWEGMAEI